MYLQTAFFLVLTASGLTNAAPAELRKEHPPVTDDAVCGSGIAHANDEGDKSPHGVPQNGESPYVIALSENVVAPENSVEITISGKGQEPIRGLTLKAKCGDKIIGSFTSKSLNVDLRNCDGVEKSGVLYIDMEKRDVREAILTWTAPAESCQDVKFHATVMKDGQTYWVQTSNLPLIVATTSGHSKN